MSNKDEIENLEEVIIESEIVKEDNSEELNKNDVLDNNVEDNSEEIVIIEKKESIFKRLFASLLDQAILIGVSALLLLVFNLFIGLFGYFVKLPTPILLIIYGIVNVLYYPIIENNGKKSIGKRILYIK